MLERELEKLAGANWQVSLSGPIVFAAPELIHPTQNLRLIWTLRLRPPLAFTRERQALRTLGRRIPYLRRSRPCRRQRPMPPPRRASRPRRCTSSRYGSRSSEWSNVCSRARTSSRNTLSVPRRRGHDSKRSASRSCLRVVHELRGPHCRHPPYHLRQDTTSFSSSLLSSSALPYVASPSRISVVICTCTESDLAIPAIFIHSHPADHIHTSAPEASTYLCIRALASPTDNDVAVLGTEKGCMTEVANAHPTYLRLRSSEQSPETLWFTRPGTVLDCGRTTPTRPSTTSRDRLQ